MIYLAIGLTAAVLGFLATRRILAAVLGGTASAFMAYIALPPLNPWFADVTITICVGLLTLFVVAGAQSGVDRRSRERLIWLGVVALVVILWPLAGGFVTAAPILHAGEYRGLLGDVEERIYSKDTSPVDVSQARIVDQDLARRLAEARLGNDGALGSQVNIGELNIQLVDGQLYWVAPLEHSGFFRWWSNRSGTPGYVMVSVTNDRDTRLVQELDGKPIRLRHNRGAFFGDEPKRFIYAHGFNRVGLTDFTFEIDDTGRPYYVVTTYRHAVGFSGNQATGVVVLDAQTGEMASYGIDDAPAWIDRIQPESFIIEQINDYGRYVRGWWNPSKREQTQATPGTSLVYGDDGQAYFYTGITSVGADEGTIGFMLVSSRDKRVRFYRQAGSTETAAMRSAEGAYQAEGFQASNPILYNVSGLPTYFTTLKDDAGLVKAFAWVSVEDRQILGTGTDVTTALRSYRQALASRGNAVAPEAGAALLQVEARVERISADVQGGSTSYYLILEGARQALFVGSSSLSPELPITRVGDSVRVTFDQDVSGVIDLVNFDNLDVTLRTSAAQQVVDERVEAAQERVSAERDEKNSDAAWESLSPEQKRQLIERADTVRR